MENYDMTKKIHIVLYVPHYQNDFGFMNFIF